VGASHQTGWTALAIRFIEKIARARAEAGGAGVPEAVGRWEGTGPS